MSDSISHSLFSKEKRQELFGDVSGGANTTKIEKFQRDAITQHTGIECKKTSGTRINYRRNTMEHVLYPNVLPNGFDYTEDFDAKQIVKSFNVYINLKNVVGKGGSQTRSLREVYRFIEAQLLLSTSETTYFANILDGNEAHRCMVHFNYLISLPEYESVDKRKIYIGDTKGYIDWFKQTFPDV